MPERERLDGGLNLHAAAYRRTTEMRGGKIRGPVSLSFHRPGGTSVCDRKTFSSPWKIFRHICRFSGRLPARRPSMTATLIQPPPEDMPPPPDPAAPSKRQVGP